MTESFRFNEAEIKLAVQQVYGINDGISGNDNIFNQTKAKDLQNVLEFWNIVPEKQADGELCGIGSNDPNLIYDKDGNPLTTSDTLDGISFNGGLLASLNSQFASHGWVA